MTVAPDAPLDHRRVIAFLAKNSLTPIEEITKLYEHEWAALEASARLEGYVPSITFGHVRALLRKLEVTVPTRLSREHAPIEGSGQAASSQTERL